MAVGDASVTLTTFLKMQAPGGDVRLTMGGFLDHDSERYTSEDDVYGTVLSAGEFDNGFGDLAEGGTLVFVPNEDADLADWYRADLADSQVEIWWGEVSGKTVSNAERLGDLLVDTISVEANEGSLALSLSLIARAEKLFITREGNVCSTRHHQKQYGTEKGFDNCTGVTGYLAWGVLAPSGGIVGGNGGGQNGGGDPFTPTRIDRF